MCQIFHLFLLPDHIHGSSTRLEEIRGVFDLSDITENTLPHCLRGKHCQWSAWSIFLQSNTACWQLLFSFFFFTSQTISRRGGPTLICSAKVFSSSVSSTAALLPELKYCAAAIIFPSSNCRFFTNSCRERLSVL